MLTRLRARRQFRPGARVYVRPRLRGGRPGTFPGAGFGSIAEGGTGMLCVLIDGAGRHWVARERVSATGVLSALCPQNPAPRAAHGRLPAGTVYRHLTDDDLEAA